MSYPTIITIHDVDITENDFVNFDEFDRNTNKAFALFSIYGLQCCVIADNLQDALDIAADEDRIQGMKVDEMPHEEAEEMGYTTLGSSCDYYDLQYLRAEEFQMSVQGKLVNA